MGTRNSPRGQFLKMDIALIDCFLATGRMPKLKGGEPAPVDRV
jgi:hypothetical protein